jgi:hypothetical protein
MDLIGYYREQSTLNFLAPVIESWFVAAAPQNPCSAQSSGNHRAFSVPENSSECRRFSPVPAVSATRGYIWSGRWI